MNQKRHKSSAPREAYGQVALRGQRDPYDDGFGIVSNNMMAEFGMPNLNMSTDNS